MVARLQILSNKNWDLSGAEFLTPPGYTHTILIFLGSQRKQGSRLVLPGILAGVPAPHPDSPPKKKSKGASLICLSCAYLV